AAVGEGVGENGLWWSVSLKSSSMSAPCLIAPPPRLPRKTHRFQTKSALTSGTTLSTPRQRSSDSAVLLVAKPLEIQTRLPRISDEFSGSWAEAGDAIAATPSRKQAAAVTRRIESSFAPCSRGRDYTK